ncbi:hypothetical protein Tco_0394721 [Tanacetum coccineum]
MDLPFEIMCVASDFAVGAILGQRKTKHYICKQTIDRGSSTSSFYGIRIYLLVCLLSRMKFRPYLVLSKKHSVYGHSALKVSARYEVCYAKSASVDLCCFTNLDVVIVIKKELIISPPTHLSDLKDPHQSELEKKEITEKFPLETLGMVTFRGDDNAPWFADFANYHAGNFMIKWMSSQQKRKFFKESNNTFGMTPSCLRYVRIK